MSEPKLIEKYSFPPKVFKEIEFLIKLESQMNKIYERADTRGYLVWQRGRSGDAATAGAYDEKKIIDVLNLLGEFYKREKAESHGFISLTYFVPVMLLSLEEGVNNENFYRGITIQVARCWDENLRYYYIEISQDEPPEFATDPFVSETVKTSLVKT